MSRDRDRGDVARVYIGDLGSGGSKPELEREFERYGPLKSVWVARNPPGIYKRHLLYLVLILLPAYLLLSLPIPSPCQSPSPVLCIFCSMYSRATHFYKVYI